MKKCILICAVAVAVVASVLFCLSKSNEAERLAWGEFLYHTSRRNTAEAMRLLENGFDPNASGDAVLSTNAGSEYIFNATALMAAACAGNVALVERLLSMGADVKAVDSRGQNCFFYALGSGSIDCAKAIFEKDKECINLRDFDGNTALHYACVPGADDAVSFVCENSHLVNVKNNTGETPLIIATYYAHTNIISLLIKHGADVNLAETAMGKTPFMISLFSIWSDGLQNAKLLYDNGAKIDAKDNTGHNAQDMADGKGLGRNCELSSGSATERIGIIRFSGKKRSAIYENALIRCDDRRSEEVALFFPADNLFSEEQSLPNCHNNTSTVKNGCRKITFFASGLKIRTASTDDIKKFLREVKTSKNDG